MINSEQDWLERNSKKILIIFILLLLLLAIVLAEYSLKIIYPEKVIDYGSQERHIRLRERPPEFKAYVYPASNEMQYIDGLDAGKKLLRTDKNGFIEPSGEYRNPDMNIVFLGGSTTECEFVEENKRFPYVVGKIIEEQTGLKVNSFNAGMYGNNTLHSINILLNKIIPMKSDIVVMMHNINDLHILMHEQTYWNNNSTRSPILSVDYKTGVLRKIKNATFPNLFRELKFHINNVLSKGSNDEFYNTRNNKITINSKKIIEQFEINLKLFVSISKISGIKPVLMTQFNRFKEKPDETVLKSIGKSLEQFNMSYQEYRELYNSLTDSILKVAAKNNIAVIDLSSKVPKTNEYMYDSIHLNNNGSLYVSKIVSDNLLHSGILNVQTFP